MPQTDSRYRGDRFLRMLTELFKYDEQCKVAFGVRLLFAISVREENENNSHQTDTTDFIINYYR